MTSKVKRELTYLIQLTQTRKSHAVIIMHSNNSQILLRRSIEVLLKTGKEIVLNKGVYTDKELNSPIGMELKLQMLDSRNDIQRTNKLVNGTKITISLNKNSDNLENGKPSNTLFTYFVTILNILHTSNPNPHNIKNLRMTQSLP